MNIHIDEENNESDCQAEYLESAGAATAKDSGSADRSDAEQDNLT